MKRSLEMSESRQKDGILGGKYTEHYDDDGNTIGESREQEGILGGNYTEHYDDDGNTIGESREQEGIFGDKYTEHYDEDGNKIGESREQEGIFGDKYTEHTGSTPYEMQNNEESLGNEIGFFEILAEKAAPVGAALGALGGLFEAFGSAESFLGYLGYIAIGAGIGGGLAWLIVTMLPWAIGLGILALLLKAFGF